MKKLACVAVLLSFTFCSCADFLYDEATCAPVKKDLTEKWDAVHDYYTGHDEKKSLAEFIRAWIKDFRFEAKDALSDEYTQKQLVCAYNFLCELLAHKNACSIQDIDGAWLDELDYQAWKALREEIAQHSDDPAYRDIDFAVTFSFHFNKAKLARDPNGQWADYASPLRYAYRFLKERGLLDASMTLANSDDWINGLEERLRNKIQ